MKRIMIMAMCIMLAVALVPLQALAINPDANGGSTVTVNGTDWVLWNPQPVENVPIGYTWTIRFSEPVDPVTISPDTLYITQEGSTDKHPLQYGVNAGQVELVTDQFFESGQAYTLWITSDIESGDGQLLNKNIRMDFITASLNPLITAPDSISIGVPSTVTFTVDYGGTPTSGMALLQVTDLGYVPHESNGGEWIWFNDDGFGGDLLQGDGKYTARTDLFREQESVLNFVAGFQNESFEWEPVSSSAMITVQEAFTEQELVVINETTTTVQQLVEQMIGENKTEAEIRDELVALLNSMDEVVEAQVSDSGSSVWFVLNSGFLGAVSIDGGQAVIGGLSQTDEETVLNDSLQGQLAALESSQETTIGNQRAVIFSASGTGEGTTVRDQLTQSVLPFQVRYLQDAQASVEEFKKLNQYGLVIFDTGGDALFQGNLKQFFPSLSSLYALEEAKSVILTGEQMTEASTATYSADLKTGRLVSVDGYYAITPAFVEHYGSHQGTPMPMSMVYAHNDQSFRTSLMADQFLQKGAQTYVGYQNARTSGSLTGTIGAMLAGADAATAVNSNAVVAGNSGLRFIAPQNIVNGSLEQGLNGWVSGGHVDSITVLGRNSHPDWATLYPTHGSRMGIISSGVDETALYGRQSWIYQTFYVPEGMTALKFDYNVVSAEPMRYIGTEFDDKFKATIVPGVVKEPGSEFGVLSEPLALGTPTGYSYRSPLRDVSLQHNDDQVGMLEIDNGMEANYWDNDWVENTIDMNEVIIGFESINFSDWGQDYYDDRQRVDVVFPVSDETTYMTGWKQVVFDVSSYQGQTISLKLQTWDLGDTIFPTAVLFDNVHLSESDFLAGVAIQGRSEVVIPREYEPGYGYDDGNNYYFYLAAAIDQYGDLWTGAITLDTSEIGYDMPSRDLTAGIRLDTPATGIYLNTQTGILTVTPDAQPGQITLTAFNDTGEDSITVNVVEAPEPVIASVEVHPWNIMVPYDYSGDWTVPFTAEPVDQLGRPVPGDYNITWSLPWPEPGFSINEATGELIISAAAVQSLPVYPDAYYLDIALEIDGLEDLIYRDVSISRHNADGLTIYVDNIPAAQALFIEVNGSAWIYPSGSLMLALEATYQYDPSDPGNPVVTFSSADKPDLEVRVDSWLSMIMGGRIYVDADYLLAYYNHRISYYNFYDYEVHLHEITPMEVIYPEAFIATFGSKGYFDDGQWHDAEASMIIVNGYLMAPLPFAAAMTDSSVDYDPAVHSITFFNGDVTVTMWIGMDLCLVNGEEQQMNTSPAIIDGRIYVPVSDTARLMESDYLWDADALTVVVW